MALTTSVQTGGTNSHATSSEEVNALGTDTNAPGVIGVITNTSGVAPSTGSFAVNAQGSPDATVAVSAGVAYVTATPTSGNSQLFRVKNSASANVTITANASGSTRFDWIYISLSANALQNPNSAGTDAATLVASRSTSATTDNGTPPTYGTLLAIVTVANGFSTITNGNITDKRVRTGMMGNVIDTNGNEVIKISATASAVNEVTANNAATAGVPGFTASGDDTNIHVQVIGKGNGLTKVSVLRQDDTTNTYKHNSVILSGWGVIAITTVANNFSETVTFGITFTQRPIVVLGCGGDSITASGSTYGTGTNAVVGQWSAKAHTLTTTNFIAHLHTSLGANPGVNGFVFYQWVAIGEL
jgi:hypothetical protein